MLKQFLESALEAELESHLALGERSKSNRKNGKMRKTIPGSEGSIDISTSRDQNSTFEPSLIIKRETILAESLESKVFSMCGLGLSLRDISSHIKEMYDTDISHAT